MKMGRRLRCSSVAYRFRYAPSSRLAGGPFSSQRKPCYLWDRTLAGKEKTIISLTLRPSSSATAKTLLLAPIVIRMECTTKNWNSRNQRQSNNREWTPMNANLKLYFASGRVHSWSHLQGRFTRGTLSSSGNVILSMTNSFN
jgi:hypothetical protein